MQVALTAVMFASHANTDVAVAELLRRAGTQLDPNLAELLVERADELLADLDEIDAYQAVLDIEPEPARRVEKDELADVARTFGNLVDLKSPWLHGHSAGVGDLAAAAAGMLGLRDYMGTVRVAGLHDLGRVGVSSAIWDKAGPLSGIERDPRGYTRTTANASWLGSRHLRAGQARRTASRALRRQRLSPGLHCRPVVDALAHPGLCRRTEDGSKTVPTGGRSFPPAPIDWKRTPRLAGSTTTPLL